MDLDKQIQELKLSLLEMGKDRLKEDLIKAKCLLSRVETEPFRNKERTAELRRFINKTEMFLLASESKSNILKEQPKQNEKVIVVSANEAKQYLKGAKYRAQMDNMPKYTKIGL